MREVELEFSKTGMGRASFADENRKGNEAMKMGIYDFEPELAREGEIEGESILYQ